MGMFFEDFEVGQEYTSAARTITETDVVMFAALTGDYNSLHTDVEYAKTTQFGQRLAHGLLGLSIVSGLMMRSQIFEGTILAFLSIDNWRFTGPIFIEDTVHFKMKIAQKKETSKADRGIIGREVSLINQRGEVVQQGQMTVMVRRKT
ncbi:MAG: MaoC/PaaZ C-terminal domain-containing protein [Peptococcaceae bacterium]